MSRTVGAAHATAYQGVDLYTMSMSTPVGYGLQTFPTAMSLQVWKLPSAGQLVGFSYPSAAEHATLLTAIAYRRRDRFLIRRISADLLHRNCGGTNGPQQVGFASNCTMPRDVSGTGVANSAVDLRPTNLLNVTDTTASGTDGVHQVGFGSAALGTTHALLWSGTGASAVDLHPGGFDSSVAIGTSGSHQVGYGLPTGSDKTHALLWNGTSASAIDLNHPGAMVSMAYGISGNQQVGSAGSPSVLHAALWNSTASAVDLNPTGFGYSEALGTSGMQQVGYGYPNGGTPYDDERHALWNGSSGSFVDLDLLLPAIFQDNVGPFHQSYAYSMNTLGDIFGFALHDGDFHAVEWVVVPEPTSLAGLSLAALALKRPAGVNVPFSLFVFSVSRLLHNRCLWLRRILWLHVHLNSNRHPNCRHSRGACCPLWLARRV